MDNLSEAIERLDKLAKPCRETDALLHVVMGYTLELPTPPCRLPDVPVWIAPDGTSTHWRVTSIDYVPRYTGSIDAALSLAPKGCGLDLKLPSTGAGLEAYTGALPSGAHMFNFNVSPKIDVVVAGSTPPITICLAAMKAIAHAQK